MRNKDQRGASDARKEDSVVMTVDEILKETEDNAEDAGIAAVEDTDAEVDTVKVDDAENEKKRTFFKKKKDKTAKGRKNMEDDDEGDDDEIDLNEPVKMGEWVLSIFLAAIPIINIICLLVWAFGHNNKPSKKTWAKAKLVWLLVEIILLALFIAFYIGVIAGILS